MMTEVIDLCDLLAFTYFFSYFYSSKRSAPMSKYMVSDYRRHHKTNLLMVFETILIFTFIPTLANVLAQRFTGTAFWLAYIPLVFFQGFWLDRIYVVGHEATHKK